MSYSGENLNIKFVLSNIGSIIVFFSFFLLVPIVPALYYSEYAEAIDFAFSAAITFVIGFSLSKLPYDVEGISDREGFTVVALGWLLIVIFGTIPYR